MLLPLRAYALSLGSLLAGAAVVHVAFAPDLRLPLREVAEAKQLPLPDKWPGPGPSGRAA